MESRPIITTTGMTPFTTVLEIHAAMIRPFLATTLVMARIRSGRQWAMTAWVTRSAWRQKLNGSDVVTWTKATAHRPGTSSAWNGFLHLTLLGAVKAIQLKLPISALMHGTARPQKVVRLAPCKPL